VSELVKQVQAQIPSASEKEIFETVTRLQEEGRLKIKARALKVVSLVKCLERVYIAVALLSCFSTGRCVFLLSVSAVKFIIS
jgi:hypothetical protein